MPLRRRLPLPRRLLPLKEPVLIEQVVQRIQKAGSGDMASGRDLDAVQLFILILLVRRNLDCFLGDDKGQKFYIFLPG